MVLGGQDDQKESDVNTAADLTSVPTEECPREEIQLDGVNIQDSDDTDSDFSALSSQPSSLNHPLFDSQSSEEINQVVTPIDGEEREVDYQWSVEEAYKGENDIQVVTVMPVECEDKSVKPVVVLATPKTGRKLMDDLGETFASIFTLQSKTLLILNHLSINNRMLRKSCIVQM